MRFLIDDADSKKIKELYEYYPVAGVTTNPSILSKAGRPPFEVLRAIRGLVGPDAQLHAQVVSEKAEGMIAEAERIVSELGENTFVKIPAVEEGFKAMKALHAKGIKITATAIYAPMQGYIAGLCGADYAAVYVNRIDNLGFDGTKVAADIHDMFKSSGLSCEVLGASFKNSYQVLELCKHGIAAVTISPEVLSSLVKNAAVDKAVCDFASDFEKLAGVGKTMLDC